MKPQTKFLERAMVRDGKPTENFCRIFRGVQSKLSNLGNLIIIDVTETVENKAYLFSTLNIPPMF